MASFTGQPGTQCMQPGSIEPGVADCTPAANLNRGMSQSIKEQSVRGPQVIVNARRASILERIAHGLA